ncbi:peptidoglycan bridge formation glycyltransferase FemA/FemB family protein [Patescibacteria group bacterium]|nr:peptidoglycan bridge formation glycyltransferase FemA/FemB family protein [Patescibacteria group bacterium]
MEDTRSTRSTRDNPRAALAQRSFLQSAQWGDLQQELAVPSWQLSYQGARALVVRRSLPALAQCWLYVPRGPLLVAVVPKAAEAWLGLQRQLLELAREQRAIFIRIEPPAGWLAGYRPGQGWRRLAHSVQPRCTQLIDLTKSTEALLADMHSKTRYNIGLAERKGVVVRFSREQSDLNTWLALARETSTRDGFRIHSEVYYRAMQKTLGEHFEIAVAEYQGTSLAANLLISYGDTVYYLHGASANENRELMAPHLLQWSAIKRAKLTGASRYDFWGVAPAQATASHSLSGVTRFKRGFGGGLVEYPGAYDYVLQPLRYWLYQTIHWWRARL